MSMISTVGFGFVDGTGKLFIYKKNFLKCEIQCHEISDHLLTRSYPPIPTVDSSAKYFVKPVRTRNDNYRLN